MKNNKHNKKRLSSLVLLLLLTVIMMSTATYAWFTANKTVTIESIDVNVATSSGLQISTDAANWKTKISNSDITAGYTGSVNEFTSEMKPVSTNGDVDTTTGYMKMYSGNVIANAAGDFILTSEALTDHVVNETNAGNYIAFDVFLKTEDINKPIYLTVDSNVIPKKTDAGAAGVDTGLKNAARVGFVVEGNGTTTDSAATLRALKGATKKTVTIWEPNADSHTANGVAAAAQYYATTTLVAGTGNDTLAYSGIKAAITDGILLAKTNPTDNASSFETISDTSGIAKLVSTIANPTAYTQLMTLPQGVTKIRVYLWVEGNDVDCENNASGSNITYNIVLSQKSEA